MTHSQAVGYGSGFFFGEEYIDTITFGSITIPQQSIGAAEFAFGFDGVDGILGYEYYLARLVPPLICPTGLDESCSPMVCTSEDLTLARL